MLLTGEPISAAEALKWGLINQVVPDGTVLEAALALAERVTVNAPLSVQASKRIAYGPMTASSPTRSRAGPHSARVPCTIEVRGRQGRPLAFAEKRQPVWKAR
ncbi:enoyl-CoA hydratase/isomerase family protein [Mycobacterium xenopi 4042]|uniref:Enoyl-CoA hydratase/isomerase family protein n=1 Tax=Mycobacterium xenopi 4042 TaxID=1299334 RepID=X8DX04_MYCXE|nr:enoyl-CoA hydratase/isomerase family protein [Mycobacterium xenopi 4042]